MKAGGMDINNKDQTAEIEYELNIVQLNKEHLFRKDIIFKSPVLQPAGQSVAKEDSFRVWCGKPIREQVSQSEARVHSKCVLCADFGRGIVHSNICICAEWGRSSNDQSPPRKANRGGKIMPGFLFINNSNARGHTDEHDNILKREAKYIRNTTGKVKGSFGTKHEAAGEAGEDKEYAQIWERNVSLSRRCLGKGWLQTNWC